MMQTVSGELRRSTKIDNTQINIKETRDAFYQSRDSNNTHDHGFRASRDVPITDRRRTTSRHGRLLGARRKALGPQAD
jgi:hypothetical protein